MCSRSADICAARIVDYISRYRSRVKHIHLLGPAKLVLRRLVALGYLRHIDSFDTAAYCMSQDQTDKRRHGIYAPGIEK